MKRRVPLPEPETLILESSSPDDPTLPRPPQSRGWNQGPARQSELEKLQLKLEDTLKLGGLVPERSDLLDRLCSQVGPLPASASGAAKKPFSNLEASLEMDGAVPGSQAPQAGPGIDSPEGNQIPDADSGAGYRFGYGDGCQFDYDDSNQFSDWDQW